MKRLNIIAAACVAAGISFSSVGFADEKGELETTMVELGYSRVNTASSHMQAAMSMRLRNETVDGWYVDASGLDNDITFVDDQGANTRVDYWANVRLGKRFGVSDSLDVFAGVDATFVKASNASSTQKGIGGHVGLEYQCLDNLKLESDVAYLEWAGDQTLQLSVGANVKLHEHAYMGMRIKELTAVDVQLLETFVGVEF